MKPMERFSNIEICVIFAPSNRKNRFDYWFFEEMFGKSAKQTILGAVAQLVRA